MKIFANDCHRLLSFDMEILFYKNIFTKGGILNSDVPINIFYKACLFMLYEFTRAMRYEGAMEPSKFVNTKEKKFIATFNKQL